METECPGCLTSLDIADWDFGICPNCGTYEYHFEEEFYDNWANSYVYVHWEPTRRWIF